MTATFTNSLPTALDRMRYALGDVNVAAALEQDETYTANLSLHGETLGIAAMAEALAARFAQKPDTFGSAGMNVSWRERVKTWLALAARLRAETAMATSGVAASFTATRGDDTESEYVRTTADAVWWT